MAQQLAGPGTRAARKPASLIAPLVLAALLAGAAVVTVDRAGCDTPGRYVTTDSGVELVGGCAAEGALHWSEPGDPAEQRG